MRNLPILAALTLPAALLLPSAAPASQSPTLLIASVRAIDTSRHTVVLPVHKGISNGTTVWYILTDVSDASQAKARGLVRAPMLADVGVTMTVIESDGVWSFPAHPNFAPERIFTAGPTGFPPKAAQPGSTAPDEYSPFVHLANSSVVYNAPIVATGDGPFDVTTHRNTLDRVLSLDPKKGTVTLLLADGFADGKRVFYISTEASDAGAATIERATYAPGLAKTPSSARLRIDVVVNGQSQGLAFAALAGGLGQQATSVNSSSLQTSRNVLGGLPAAIDGGGVYDPLWDAYIGAWTDAAVAAKQSVQLHSAAEVQKAADAGLLTAPDGKPFGPAGIAVNCPVVAVE